MLIDEDDYRRWDAVEMARLVRAGEVTAADLTETADALLDKHSDLNAVAARLDPGADLGVGTAAPGAWPGPWPVTGPTPHDGLLAGVPTAVKEVTAWPGLPWTMASRMLAANPAPWLSPYAHRLAASGLQVRCSTTSSELGLLGSTETALHGVTRNPWRDGLSAGGSSGGSAVLVAAGVLPVAHGNDAGGSLRVPAALNGVVGFKPSGGRCHPSMPEQPGLGALVVDHVMTRSVRDTAAVLAATERTGPDAVHPPVGLVEGADGARLRVGLVTTTLVGGEPEAPVRREVERVAGLLASLGHDTEVAALPPVDGEAFGNAFFTTAALTVAGFAGMMTPVLGRPPGPDELEPFSLELVEWAGTFGPDAAAGAQQAIRAAATSYLTLFDRYDVVLSPTLSVVSWPVGHLAPDVGREVLVRRTAECVGYTPVHNPAGCPAVSLPLGRHDGLPVGVHLAAAPGADALLLRLAYALEATAPWHDARPGGL